MLVKGATGLYAAMELIIQDKCVIVYHEQEFQLAAPSLHCKMVPNAKMSYRQIKEIQYDKGKWCAFNRWTIYHHLGF